VVGALVAYQFVLPPIVESLMRLSFVPGGPSLAAISTVMLDDYVSFVARVLLLGGLALAIPAFVVVANVVQVVPLRTLPRYAPYVGISLVVIAWLATPSIRDALYVLVVFAAAFAIGIGMAWLLPRRRAAATP
jgi:Sec-independent protein secretion pathway component TatC